jgi:hypothetical protein
MTIRRKVIPSSPASEVTTDPRNWSVNLRSKSSLRRPSVKHAADREFDAAAAEFSPGFDCRQIGRFFGNFAK